MNETIELTDEEFNILAKKAHEQDITFNQLVNNVLRDYMNIQKFTNITVEELQERFDEIIENIEINNTTYFIYREGRPEAVLVSINEYDRLIGI